MKWCNPYPHGGDLSIYPTVRVMRDAFFFGYYRSYPHQAEVRIGPLPATAANADETTRGVMAEMRPTCHAVIVMPRKVLLIRFARRATGQDVERLEHERDLLRQTPELAAVLHWPIEARLVHCDIADGVKELARARGVRMALYRPRWLATFRPRNVPAPSHGFVVRRFDPQRLAQYAATHTGPLERIADPTERARARTAYLAGLTPEQLRRRNSKAMSTRWARMSAEARSEVCRERGAVLWGDLTAEQRSDLARRLNDIRWSNPFATAPGKRRA